MSSIEVFAEIICPFTHVGLRRLIDARNAQHTDAPVRVRAWPLELVNDAPQDPDLLAREVDALRAEIAPELFRGFDPEHLPRTSILGFGLAAAAYEQRGVSVGERVSLALRDAVFEDGLDIGDAGVIAALAAQHDIELPSDADADAIARADWSVGQQRDVQGSPHFFVGDNDWFCPGLSISHDGDEYDIVVDDDHRRELYTAAFG